MRRKSCKCPLLFAILVLVLASCDVGYYWQAARGQLEILRLRRPIGEVLADPEVPEPTKAKLRLVLEVQAFGIERMTLPDEGRYTTYADLKRPQVTWLVVASEPYRIQAVEHCYWIVGCLEYRGYFAREDADAFAAELAGQGYDVLVRPVRAYSTLGWFEDPVLNTFLFGDEIGLMGTVLHEQGHRALFVKGDTTFNESFAEFVEQEGVTRYLAGQGESGQDPLRRYRDMRANEARFREIVRGGRARLEKLYSSPMPEPEMHAEKTRLFDVMRRDYENARNSFILLTYDAWFAQPLNNAHLVSIEQYESRVGAFATLFRESGQDFRRFLVAARALAELPEHERRARLDALERGS
jgi:predicted aminopeptidase